MPRVIVGLFAMCAQARAVQVCDAMYAASMRDAIMYWEGRGVWQFLDRKERQFIMEGQPWHTRVLKEGAHAPKPHSAQLKREAPIPHLPKPKRGAWWKLGEKPRTRRQRKLTRAYLANVQSMSSTE